MFPRTRPTAPAPFLLLLLCLGLAALPALTAGAASPANTTSDLLLPYFEVDLDGTGITTLMAVVNTSDREVPVVATVHTNWGQPVLEVPMLLAPHAVRSVNLSHWLLAGTLPDDVVLPGDELAHLQAALCGEVSPRDGLYYGGFPSADVPPAAGEPSLAVGYVTVRAQRRSDDVLMGDYFLVDESGDYSQADNLVNVDPTAACGQGLCRRHGLRFLNGGSFDGGTELLIWTPRRNPATDHPTAALSVKIDLAARAFGEHGRVVAEQTLEVQPLERIRVADLGLGEAFGWLDVTLPMDAFVAVRYTARDRFSAVFRSACLELVVPPGEPRPGLEIEKLTNGVDADQAPGVALKVGDQVTWEYRVANTGAVALSGITVEDDDDSLTVVCPGDSLAPGGSMVCTAEGVAGQCGYRNVGTVHARSEDGASLSATDASHYFASQPAALEVELSINGDPADAAPGLPLSAGEAIAWAYTVRNTGEADLTGVVVTDTAGQPVACPSSELVAGETMTCHVAGVAQAGGGHGRMSARGKTSCGAAVSADDEAFYACGPCLEEAPGLSLEKATNGHDADVGPGPEIAPGTPITWSYVVTNTGGTPLSGLVVSDDDSSLTVVCPGDSLQAGQSMTCTALGSAGEGDYVNLGEARGFSHCGVPVSAGDRSHYHNEPTPPETGDQGCTPGYWKNHADSWAAAGYAPGSSLTSVFAAGAGYPDLAAASLMEALSFSGGSGVDGAARNLMRAAVAGLLDASHPGVAYPRAPAAVIADVDAALAGADRDAILALAASLDADNNLGCPLN